MAEEHPVLLPQLRSALSCLYGNDDGDPRRGADRNEAHEFLLGFKSSNARRSVTSRVQSQKDRVRGGGGYHVGNGGGSEGDAPNNLSLDQLAEELHPGSIFLSCLALAARSRAGHERMFAAQTLKHRCRSVKLVETLDIEAEDGIECGVARLVLAWEEVRAERARLSSGATADANGVPGSAALAKKSNVILTAWLERYVPMLINRCGGGAAGPGCAPSENGSLLNGAELLALVVRRSSSSLLAGVGNSDEGEQREEKIKGTLIMLSLAVAMYVSAFCAYEEENGFYQQRQQQQQQQARSPWANSVLSDLGNALSITALRVRYRPVNDKYATPPPDPSCPPLIDMLVNAVNLAKEAAEHLFSQAIQQHDQQQQHAIQTAIQQAHEYAVRRSVAACIKALPETVLLPPGGEDAGHRVPSVDRACLRAASMELRSVGSNLDGDVGTGMDKAWKVLVESEQRGDSLSETSATQLLECCEAWARYVAVPVPVIEETVGRLALRYLHPQQQREQHEKAQGAAFQYLVSIFESASPSLKPDDVLAAALGVGAGGHHGKGGKGGGGGPQKKNTSNKMKKGSRGKKRHERRLGRTKDGVGVSSEDAAEEELLARRNAACVPAAAVFGISLVDGSARDEEAGLRRAATTEATSTHGVCSTVAAAANSVLPHLLFLERGDGEEGKSLWRLQLFSSIAAAIGRMCASPTRDFRALAYEPLMVLHASLNSADCVSSRMEQVAVDAICECTLALATSCGYPPGYFDNLHEDGDEELEIERNDVRDVARSVCSLDAGDATGARKSPSVLILERFITACNDAVQHATSTGQLPPETVVHVLSSLAKPLNKLGKNYGERRSDVGCAIMTASLLALGSVCDQLNSSFESRPVSEILPLSRLACMGMASFSPMFSSLASVMRDAAAAGTNSPAEKEMISILRSTFLSSLRHSLVSTARIPELVKESTLESTRYDVKGAMRGPGGEDHVGCIALLRFSHESDCLTSVIFEVYGSAILQDLSCLYQGLKTSELERGFGCDYGKGVTPISRRIVLRVLSRLALYEMKGTNNNQSGEGGAILHQLVQAPLGEMRSQREAPFSADKLFRVCEASVDLSFFSPELVADLLDSPSSDDVGIAFECVISGYSRLSFSDDADVACQQWGRLRGGVLGVLRTSLKENISEYCANILSALTKAECEAATVQCNQGPKSGSNLFNDNVVGEEMIHAGAYIVLIGECLDRIAKKKEVQISEKFVTECRRCLSVLKDVAPVVMPLLLHQSPEANSHEDPRPTIAEAWFVTMTSLVSVCRNHKQIAASLVGDEVESFLGESLSLAMMLIFQKDLGTRRTAAPDIQRGMSLDGPHTLAVDTFFSESMLLGPSILSAGGRSILALIQLDDAIGQSNIGAIILTASVLRAVSGALPPWAVEDCPTLFRSLFVAMDSDPDKFIQILSAATKVKASSPFGPINPGELLAGRYLDVSHRHIESFLHQSKAVCIKGDWRKLKVILKSTCGGKKKDAGFNLKPQFTSWECERL